MEHLRRPCELLPLHLFARGPEWDHFGRLKEPVCLCHLAGAGCSTITGRETALAIRMCTDSSLDIWSTLDSPIAHHLLVTTESAYWLPFLKFFAWEISVDNIATTEDIVERLKETSPELAEHTAQYIFDGWTPGT
jgi:hypothetical protein